MLERAELLPEHIRLAAMEWHIRMINDAVSVTERADFEAWRGADERHAEAYDRASQLWTAYGKLEKTELDPALFERNRTHSSKSLGGFWQIAKTQSAAAVGAFAAVTLMVFLVSQLWVSSGGVEDEAPQALVAYTSDTGEGRVLVLADASEVTLGPDTRIEVAMSESSRQIRLLRGAAVFSVASDPDRPFYVQADRFTARAVGTVFDVRFNGGVVRLSVSEGIVEALHPREAGRDVPGLLTKVRLHAGELLHATTEHGLSTVSAFDISDFAVWRNDRLQYEDAPLSELIADANRYSERPIEFDESIPDPSSIRVTFSFSGHRVERMLDALPALFPIQVDSSDPAKFVLVARGDP